VAQLEMTAGHCMLAPPLPLGQVTTYSRSLGSSVFASMTVSGPTTLGIVPVLVSAVEADGSTAVFAAVQSMIAVNNGVRVFRFDSAGASSTFVYSTNDAGVMAMAVARFSGGPLWDLVVASYVGLLQVADCEVPASVSCSASEPFKLSVVRWRLLEHGCSPLFLPFVVDFRNLAAPISSIRCYGIQRDPRPPTSCARAA
jgi:hypothetical protein